MRAAPFLLVAGLMLTVPLAAATQTYAGVLPIRDVFLAGVGVPNPVSSPLLQSADQFNVFLEGGDSVSATLAWTDSSGGAAGGNDLDLTLLLPSAAPVPLTIPPSAGTVLAIAQGRVARTTCTDAAAESSAHPGGASESVAYTVPAGGEVGSYALIPRAYLMTVDQPYTLTVTVLDRHGADATAARLGPVQPTVLITTNPHCQAL